VLVNVLSVFYDVLMDDTYPLTPPSPGDARALNDACAVLSVNVRARRSTYLRESNPPSLPAPSPGFIVVQVMPLGYNPPEMGTEVLESAASLKAAFRICVGRSEVN
jgi:hypothetical protein